MTADAPSSASPTPLSITACDDSAVFCFTGQLTAQELLRLEQQLLDPRLTRAGEWVWDMSGLEHLDLICAYALLRSARRTASGPIRVRGARRNVQRTLRYAGVQAIVTVDA
ncbi:STAS domain-containing protein [Streptomyces sp. NPDC006463]|uniref:STAS domain-containing protein n=1 Tax=Streptomyces sp. NPDC006463 TaxID=3364746 RepID=UPI0036C1462F